MGRAKAHVPGTGGQEKVDAKAHANWLQNIIDTLASQYTWSKEDIFSLFPAEIEIYLDRIAERKLEESNERQLEIALSAGVIMANEDYRRAFFNRIKYAKGAPPEEDVTPESIAADNEIAKRVLGM